MLLIVLHCILLTGNTKGHTNGPIIDPSHTPICKGLLDVTVNVVVLIVGTISLSRSWRTVAVAELLL